MISPLPDKVTAYRLNRTLHGYTRYRPAHCRGHDAVLWYLGAPVNADAGDLFCPAGTPVVAMHDGLVTRYSQRLGAVYVVNPWAVTVYAHLDLLPWIREGYRVKMGEKLGRVSGTLVKDPHLHLEVFTRGITGMKAITGKTPQQWATAVAKRIG